MAEVLCETLMTAKEELAAGKGLLAEVQGEDLMAGNENLMAGEESLMAGKVRLMAGEEEWREEEPACSTRRDLAGQLALIAGDLMEKASVMFKTDDMLEMVEASLISEDPSFLLNNWEEGVAVRSVSQWEDETYEDQKMSGWSFPSDQEEEEREDISDQEMMWNLSSSMGSMTAWTGLESDANFSMFQWKSPRELNLSETSDMSSSMSGMMAWAGAGSSLESESLIALTSILLRSDIGNQMREETLKSGRTIFSSLATQSMLDTAEVSHKEAQDLEFSSGQGRQQMIGDDDQVHQGVNGDDVRVHQEANRDDGRDKGVNRDDGQVKGVNGDNVVLKEEENVKWRQIRTRTVSALFWLLRKISKSDDYRQL